MFTRSWLSKAATKETRTRLALTANLRSPCVLPLSVCTPATVMNLLLNKFGEIDVFIELIGLGSRITDPAFDVEIFSDLVSISYVSQGGTFLSTTFITL